MKRRPDSHLVKAAQRRDKNAHGVPSARHVVDGKGSTNPGAREVRLTRNRTTGLPSGVRDVKPK